MKRKILASIAMGLITMGGALTPVFGLVTPLFKTAIASACTGIPCVDAPVYGPQQQPDQGNGQGIPFVNNTYQGPGGGPNGQGAETNPNGTTTPNAGGVPGADAAGSKDLCGVGDIACGIISGISEIIMFVPTRVATISGLVFDYSVWYSIQSGTYTQYDGAPGDEGMVVMGWKLIRDFTNLIFIFALFVIAFTLILDLDTGSKVSMTSNPKRTIARVLLMALLINFSFFLGRVVIDISNKMSQQFYTNMSKAPQITTTANDSQTDVQSFYTSSPGVHSIASAVISQVNPQNFLLANSNISKIGPGTYGFFLFLSLASACFNIFLIYIFLSIALLFISRTVGLFLGIIISPLAFVSYTIPSLQKQPYIGFDDWMKQFMGLAFMAPIFLFFMYISIQFLKMPLSTSGDSGSMTIAAKTLFSFAMVGMFLTFAKRISKDMSGKIGDMATSAVTGIVTGVAAVGMAAATGGTSSALQMARLQTKKGVIGASEKVFGAERTMQMRQSLNRGVQNFRMLPSDKGQAVTNLATMLTGSKVPGQIHAEMNYSKELTQRNLNIQKIRSDKVAAEQRKLALRTSTNYDQRKAAMDLKQARGGTPATLGDGRTTTPKQDRLMGMTDKQKDRINKRLKENRRTAYNYADRKKAMDLKNSKPGPKPTLGDGTAKAPVFTATQQTRIARKLEENKLKTGAGIAGGAGAAATTTPPPNPPAGGASPIKSIIPPTGATQPVKPSGLVDQYGNPISSTTTPPPNPPAGGASPAKPNTPPTGGVQPAKPAAPTPTKLGQTEPQDGTSRPKNAFTGNADFDRPKVQLVDPQGRPVSSTDAAQKAESEALTNQYNRTQNQSGSNVQVENLTVKNLKVENIGGAPAPSNASLPDRQGSSSSSVPAKQHATNLLSEIQMTPRSGSAATNYKASDFATPTQTARPATVTASAAKSGIVDVSGNPISTSSPTPKTEPKKIITPEEASSAFQAVFQQPATGTIVAPKIETAPVTSKIDTAPITKQAFETLKGTNIQSRQDLNKERSAFVERLENNTIQQPNPVVSSIITNLKQ